MYQTLLESVLSGKPIIPVIGFDAFTINNKPYLRYFTETFCSKHELVLAGTISDDIQGFSKMCYEFKRKLGPQKQSAIKTKIIDHAVEIESLVECHFLDKLSRIIPFKHFLNVTFTNFVELSLRKKRAFPEGNYCVAAYPYILDVEKRNTPADLPIDDLNLSIKPVIYNFLGTYQQSKQNVFITDDDILYFTGDLCKKYDSCLKNLQSKILNSSLLLLGCNYPDWLFRYFISTLKPNFQDENTEIYLDKSSYNSSIEYFVNKHGITVLDDDVDILTDKLFKDFKGEKLVVEDRETEHIFISYAREDEKLALRIADWLTINGKNVWLDIFKLKKGDQLNDEVATAINNCKSFVPIVTTNSANKNDLSYVKKEWNHYASLKDKMQLIPILKDFRNKPLNFTWSSVFNREEPVFIELEEEQKTFNRDWLSSF